MGIGTLKAREVRKGSKNYGPDYPRALRYFSKKERAKGISFAVRLEIPAESYFDPRPYGSIGTGWLKAGGRTFFSPCKPKSVFLNEFAALFAFRPTSEPGTWEAAGYTNFGEKGTEIFRTDEQPRLKFSAREDGGFAELYVDVLQDRVIYALRTNYQGEELELGTTHDFDALPFSFTVSPHHGGRLPAVADHKIFTVFSDL